jgi:hypothetical protein
LITAVSGLVSVAGWTEVIGVAFWGRGPPAPA